MFRIQLRILEYTKIVLQNTIELELRQDKDNCPYCLLFLSYSILVYNLIPQTSFRGEDHFPARVQHMETEL